MRFFGIEVLDCTLGEYSLYNIRTGEVFFKMKGEDIKCDELHKKIKYEIKDFIINLSKNDADFDTNSPVEYHQSFNYDMIKSMFRDKKIENILK